jgi:hypothetical protein
VRAFFVMKKAILTLLVAFAAQAATVAQAAKPAPPPAGEPTYTVVLAGGSAENMIEIWLSADGRIYVIDSVVPLEVGGSICENPPGNTNELLCQAPVIAGFEVNAGSGDDHVTVADTVAVPVTLRGGAGDDTLWGGSGADKLIGGAGEDRLSGRAGDDLLYGGPGDDVLKGGFGDDVVYGGPGEDLVLGGSGKNKVRQSQRPAIG